MTRPILFPGLFPGLAALALTACGDAPLPDVTRLVKPGETAAVFVDPETGACLARDETPAEIETVTEHVMVQPAQVGPDGALSHPAVYKTETRQVIVKPRRELTFETLCEAEMTPELVASLQRALAARGLYAGPVNGQMTWRTRRAVRHLQQRQGLDSAILARRTARDLGLVAFDTTPEGWRRATRG